MDSGTAAVFGSAIGVMGTVIGNLTAARSSRAQIKAAHAQWLLEGRRRAYTDLVSAARAFQHAWRELSEAVEVGSKTEAMLARVAQLYAEMSAAESTVQVLGPEQVADKAKAFLFHARAMDWDGTRWIRSGDVTSDHRDAFKARHDQYREVLEPVWEQARLALKSPKA
jgi:hypothetical protein